MVGFTLIWLARQLPGREVGVYLLAGDTGIDPVLEAFENLLGIGF